MATKMDNLKLKMLCLDNLKTNQRSYFNLLNSAFWVSLQKTFNHVLVPKIVSEYDQEIPQSQTADKPMGL